MGSGADLLRDALVEAGIPKDVVVARVIALKTKYSTGEIAEVEVENILRAYVSEEFIINLMRKSVPAWIALGKAAKPKKAA